jgi:hypothetical protein
VPVAEVIDYIDAHRHRVVEGRKLGVETPDPRTGSSQAAVAVWVGGPNAVVSS